VLKVLGMKPFSFAAALVPSVLVALLAAPAAHADELPTLPAPTATPVAPAEAPEAPAPTPSTPEAAPAPAPAASAPTLVARETAPKKRRAEGEEAPREWYGYQTLVVDLAGIGMGVGAAGGGYPLAIAGLATYVVGGPIVHAAHGHGGKVGLDLGIRLGAPAAGALTGALIACAGGSCGYELGALVALAGGGFGAGIGAITAIVIDAAVIAREPAERREEVAKWDGKPIVRPEVTSLPGGGAVGIGGAF
jgi:hypothetical protein